jgi:hypothetical protein
MTLDCRTSATILAARLFAAEVRIATFSGMQGDANGTCSIL